MGILIRCILCAAFLLLPVPSQAQQGEALHLYEQKIKAGLIYNFLKFTAWPESSLSQNGGKLNVCLFGGDPFDGYLYPLEGRTAQQYLISIKKIDAINQLNSCNLIVVHHDRKGSLPQLFQSLKGKPILTISDINDFARQGGMVEMVKEEERVNLYINEKEASNAGVQIQSRILKFAKLVSTNG